MLEAVIKKETHVYTDVKCHIFLRIKITLTLSVNELPVM